MSKSENLQPQTRRTGNRRGKKPPRLQKLRFRAGPGLRWTEALPREFERARKVTKAAQSFLHGAPFAHAVGPVALDRIASATSLRFAILAPNSDLRQQCKVKSPHPRPSSGAPGLRGQPASCTRTPKPEERGQAEPD